MMRRILGALVGALAALLLGAVSVAAFEAHAINVTAKVSNALTVTTTQGTAIGTQAAPADPLTWKKLPIDVALSGSFLAQGRVTIVAYKVCGGPKADLGGTHPGTPNTALAPYTYLWMGGSSFVEMDPAVANTGPFHWIGPSTDITPPPGGANCPVGAADTLTNPTDPTDTVYLWSEAPVFQGFYNAADDVNDKPRNNLADCGAKTDGQPCVILPIPPASTLGTLLGMDVIIQVTAIS